MKGNFSRIFKSVKIHTKSVNVLIFCKIIYTFAPFIEKKDIKG